MAVRLEGSIKRFIGDSTDRKPEPGNAQADGTVITKSDLLPGSSFLEEDSGIIYRWTGVAWSQGSGNEDMLALQAILQEIQGMRADLRDSLMLQ